MVADVEEELENLDASEIHARRLTAKEILTPKSGEKSYSQSQMEQQNCLAESMESENPL